ncbi:unnamed protein product [Calicophoron daubneyi]|uniref:Chromo domain-containing protein n=1 Tax=Calicophoron daubneyi TaxID=300641 RepID=A0AAV2T6G4_CALDB
MSASTDLKPKYEPGEKLLCFHGPLLYEAKCLDVKVKEDGVMYFVHYQGWNKNWDEWVADNRMFKFNEEGLKKQKELEQQIKSGKKVKVLRKSDLKKQSYPPPEIMRDIEQTLRPIEVKQESESPKSKSKPPATSPPAPTPPSTHNTQEIKPEQHPVTTAEIKDQTKDLEVPGKPASVPEESAPVSHPTPVSARRRKGRPVTSEGAMENDEGFLQKPQLKVEMPDSLKAWLVDDWDLITRQARLYELPASYPISSVMSDFLQFKQKEQIDLKPEEKLDSPEKQPDKEAGTQPIPPVHITSDLRNEFVAGLQHYFNLVVGSQLLYKFERLQYAELLKQQVDKRMSDVYGCMHLLRLFVKLREMVSCTRVDANSLPVLEALVAEFLELTNETRLVSSSYMSPLEW